MKYPKLVKMITVPKTEKKKMYKENNDCRKKMVSTVIIVAACTRLSTKKAPDGHAGVSSVFCHYLAFIAHDLPESSSHRLVHKAMCLSFARRTRN